MQLYEPKSKCEFEETANSIEFQIFDFTNKI